MKTNEILLGDCLDLLKSLPDAPIDLVATDPPYLINYQTGRRQDQTHRFTKPIANDTNVALIEQVVPELYRVLKENTAFYCFCSPDTVEIFKTIIQHYFKIKNLIIWVKNNWTAGDLEAQYGKQYEIIIYANKGRRAINGKRITDVWNINRVNGNDQLHQNQKPLSLMERMIMNSSAPGDIVLDPFAGSGSTCVAAKAQGRKYIGMELDAEFVQIANQRLAQGALFEFA